MNTPEPDHELSVTLTRAVPLDGFDEVRVACRRCGWAMTYRAPAILACYPPQAHVWDDAEVVRQDAPLCGQDTRELASRVTVQCALPAGHGGMCTAAWEGPPASGRGRICGKKRTGGERCYDVE